MSTNAVQQSGRAKPGFFYGYVVVIAAFFILLVSYGVNNAFGIFFNPVLNEFGWTRAITSGAFSLSWIVYGIWGIAMGRLNDKLGPRLVLTVSGLFLGLGYLLMPQIHSIWQLYLFYGVIIGSGMGGTWIPLMSTVTRWFVKRRSMMTGIALNGIGVGTLLASPVASRLISIYDWRASYFMLGCVVLLVMVLAAQMLRRDPEQMNLRPDGINVGDVNHRLSVAGYSITEAASTRQFWFFAAIMLLHGFCVFAVTVHIVPHATELGISDTGAANILAIYGGSSIIGRLVLGTMADKIGNRKVMAISLIIESASLFWLLPATELWALYVFAAVFGFAFSGFGPSVSPMSAGLFGLGSHGFILSIINLGFTTGSALGPFVAGYIFDITGSYHMAFLLCAVSNILGAILASLLTPTKVKPVDKGVLLG